MVVQISASTTLQWRWVGFCFEVLTALKKSHSKYATASHSSEYYLPINPRQLFFFISTISSANSFSNENWLFLEIFYIFFFFLTTFSSFVLGWRQKFQTSVSQNPRHKKTNASAWLGITRGEWKIIWITMNPKWSPKTAP